MVDSGGMLTGFWGLLCVLALTNYSGALQWSTNRAAVSWDIQWGMCSASCGEGLVKPQAVCISGPTRHELGNAACHGLVKPILPENKACTGDSCAFPIDNRRGEMSPMLFDPVHCDRTIQDSSGTISSPDWPAKSTRYLQCRLTILSPGKRLRLSFDTFTLEGAVGEECTENNYVKILDVGSNRSQSLCGSSRGVFTWTADTGHVEISFGAESPDVFHSFHASFVSIGRAPDSECSDVYIGPMGRYSSDVPSLPHQRCEVLFHTGLNERVILSFSIFEVPCEQELKITEVETGEETFLCGSYDPFSWTSRGNEAILTYVRPVMNEQFDVELEYEPLAATPSGINNIDCCLTFSGADEGWITSPDYPNAYPDFAHCRTLILGEPGTVVTISFQDFMVEPSNSQDGQLMNSCQFDYVMLVDITTDMTAVFCGRKQPFSWTSDSNQVMVLFVTDSSESFSGYSAKYYIGVKHPLPDCIVITETDPGQNLSSLGYPQPYPSNLECVATVQNGPGVFTIFDLAAFDLETSDGCEKDYLQFTDLTTYRSNRYCGHIPSFTWTSDGNEVQITFRTDDMIQRTGFQMKSLTVLLPARNIPARDCRAFLSKTRGFVQLPLSLGSPPLGDAECMIVISVEPAQRIVLMIDVLAIEPPPIGRDPDYLQIKDMAVHPHGMEEVFMGKLPSFTWTSRRNELVIVATQLSSDIASVLLHGTYHADQRPLQACSRRIQDQFGSIFWPANFTSDATDCELALHTDPFNRIVLTFDTLEVSAGGCQDFSLEIFDVGPSRILTYCETQAPFSIMSTSNEIRLRFKRSNGVLGMSRKRQLLEQGQAIIIARYYVMDRPLKSVEHVAEYHRVLRTPTGEFSSLDHGRAHWMTGNCTVIIDVPSSSQIVIHFQDFLIGEQVSLEVREHRANPCRPEFVLIEDMTSGRSNIFCGKFESFAWLSDTNMVLVTFFTNPVIVYHGFRAKYKTIPRSRGLTHHTSESMGIFESSNFPDPYPSNSEERWIIHSTPVNLVSLVFNSFQLEASPDCSKDYVKIEDLSSGYSDTICGVHGQFVWTSEGTEVIVTMVTDGEVNDTGLSFMHSLMFVNEDCNMLLRGETGSLSSAEFLEYGVVWHGSCHVMIHTSPDQRLNLVIEGLQIDENCGNAGITIVDIATLRSRVICEASHAIVFTSDSNEIFLSYINYESSVPEFTISWQSLRRDVEPVECSSIFDEPSPRISLTANLVYLSILPVDSVCHVLFTLPPVETVLLLVREVYLPGMVCDEHYIEIEDLATFRYDRYCDVELPFAWKADGNEVMVRFSKTTQVGVPIGIEVVVGFESIREPLTRDCSKVLTADSGDLQSVNYPANYPSDIGCHTLIHAWPDSRIQITFSQFELEGPTEAGCTSDYLMITDLTSGNSSTLCGLLGPFVWSSWANEVLLEFVSDSTNVLPGYSAYYRILPKISSIPGCNETLVADNGVVQSPNLASASVPYPASTVCLQRIKVLESQQIILSFTILSLESDRNCRKDYIEIFDALTLETNLYCGVIAPFTWLSQGNEIVVKFHTDGQNNYQGYRATYKAVERTKFSTCDLSTSSSSGTIQSPIFPLPYTNNLDCVTKIMAPEYSLIQIIFSIFQLEESPACVNDYLELRTQGFGSPQTFCGSKSPFSWLSDGNVVVVTFHTDHIITKLGYKAEYEVLAKPGQLNVCDESFYAPNGTLTSLHYPKEYPSNEDCRTMIIAQPGYVIQVTFADFEVEYQDDCKYDYVQISNFPDGTDDKFCGSLDPFNWVSDTNRALLEFHSDASTRSRGYLAHYIVYPAPIDYEPIKNAHSHDVKCSVEMTALQGVLTSPNFPYEYYNNQECRTELETANGTKINMMFHFMDIEEHRGCEWDYVQIFDLQTGTKSPPFCGSLFGKVTIWQSDSNRIAVVFRSDEIVTRIGFYATYTVMPIT